MVAYVHIDSWPSGFAPMINIISVSVLLACVMVMVVICSNLDS